MKEALFICDSAEVRATYAHPWKEGRFYNSRELELPAGKGTLNVKKSFSPKTTKKNIKSVKIRATALGIFDLFLNGKRVGETTENGKVFDELKPGWTDYRFRVFEFEYDVTNEIKAENTLVAVVSGGWWSGRISFGYYGFRRCAFCGEIEIEYKDGSSELIPSGTDWQVSLGGPILTADIWDGEYYDARIPHPSVCPEAHEWKDAEIFDDFAAGKLIIEPARDRIRAKQAIERRPLSAVIHNGTLENGSDYGRIRVLSKAIGDGCEAVFLKKGRHIILDMGQNMVGRPEITVWASKGTKITGVFAEFLNDSGLESRGNDGPEGSMYVKNYRSAMSRFVYVAAGRKHETYAPTHAFYGFRYLELSADSNIRIVSVKGVVLGSEMRETAGFECDAPEVNKLWSNVLWGMRCNYLSVPTDCPQRDERLGWTGDTQVFCGAGSYLADVEGFLSKWLTDVADSQVGYNGCICDVVPRVFERYKSNAAWADAGIVVPHRLWLMYGNRELVERQYPSMEYYMEDLSQYGLEGPNTAYGDWLNYDVTDKRYIAVCYYKHDADVMASFSEILGKTERAEYYRELSERIRAHFIERYTENGALKLTTQTCYLLALAFDMLPEEWQDGAKAGLRKKIEDNNYTLSTGFVGTGILNQTLAKFGLNDLAYSLLLQTNDPSWLYSVKQGATTVWERWNSYTKETGFGNVSMNSFNHYAYGAVAEWMMAYVAGIRPDESAPGFAHFILAPEPDTREYIPNGQKRIKRASAYYDSRHGRIESAWEYVGERIEYRFTVPSGTSATVKLRIASKTVKLNGVSFKTSELGTVENGVLSFEASAGKYTVTE